MTVSMIQRISRCGARIFPARFGLFFAAFLAAVVFFSCIGAGSDISLRADGSGSINLEYRLARDMEKMGKLDGNERRLPVPAGRADLERTVRRIEGLRLVSFKSKEDGKDMVYSARLDFSSPSALTAFLDASGSQAELDMAKRKAVFTFTGAEPRLLDDSSLRDFIVRSLSGYDFSLAMKLPSAVSIRWLDSGGKETRNPGAVSVKGSGLRFSSSMSDLVLLEKTAIMEISW